MNEIVLDAYSKINLTLDITGKRDDGYHLVKMIMQSVGIKDVVTIRKSPEKADKITLTCSRPEVPLGEDNIAWKAASKIISGYGINEAISIHIEKNIPMAAGMAGGSTDAAAVIKGMNELFCLNISETEMDALALSLGADIPFCLRRGTYLSEGIGEILTKLDDAPEAHVVVVNPPFGLSTAAIYKKIDSVEHAEHPDVDKAVSAIADRDLNMLSAVMGNILEEAALVLHPEIENLKKEMLDLGAAVSMMTGSGPTVFGLFKDKKSAESAFEYFRRKPEKGRSFLTAFVR